VVEVNPVAQLATGPLIIIQIVGHGSKTPVGVTAAAAVFADKELAPVTRHVNGFAVGTEDVVSFAAISF
jgi:hypothetical protein